MKRILCVLVLLLASRQGFAQDVNTVLSQQGRPLEVTFTTTTVQAVGTTDAVFMRTVSVHIVTQGGSSTVTFQQSNDNTNWVSTSLMVAGVSGTTSPVTATTGTGLYHGRLIGRYFRLNVTGIASGTTAGVLEFSPQADAEFTSANSVTFITGSVTPGTSAGHLGKAEDAAHTSGDTGVAIWGVRKDTTTETTSADGDYSQASTDSYGGVFTRTDPINPFTCSLDNIAATLTECQPAAAAGLSLYVTDIIAQSTTATAGQFLLRQGTGTNCGTGTASVFPSSASVIRFAAPGNTVAPLVVSLKSPIKLTAANALCLLGVATNTVTVSVGGWTAR